MSAADDRDLSAAFEELTAPASSANYSSRTPTVSVRSSSTRWPQVLATALAVVVAVAGAGTFLALRSARQGGVPSSSAGTPPARTGAALAYDSSAGVTVMFGGLSRSGQALSDTWTWDGSAWRAAAGGPGPLAAVRLVDDPADGGVLLLGAPSVPVSGAVVGGCSGGGVAVPGTTSASANPAATGSAAKRAPVGPVPTDAVPSPLPSNAAIAPGPSVSSAPVSLCPVPAPLATPSAQTWVFNSAGWHRATPGSAPVAPPAGAELAFDFATRQVVAVSSTGITCGPPREGAVRSGAAIVCPALGGASATADVAPCGAGQGCLNANPIATWTWSNGSWRSAPVDPSVRPNGTTLLFSDPATQHAILMTQSGVGPTCCVAYPQIKCTQAQSCPPTAPAPQVTTWTWSGSGWVRLSQVPAPPQGPDLVGGAAVAATAGHLVVLTVTGDTWTFAAGQWTLESPSQHPSGRAGAAIAEGPNGSVVLFGGTASAGFYVSASGASVGSDTWLWNGRTWQPRGGAAPASPPPPPSPSFPCGATGTTVVPPCVQPLPARVPAVAPSASP